LIGYGVDSGFRKTYQNWKFDGLNINQDGLNINQGGRFETGMADK
jgi:hypothetical protein